MPRGASGSSEAGTRRDLIDPMLRKQGWKIVAYIPGNPTSAYTHHAVTEYPTANGPADYALFVGGILVGIIEAKRLSLGPQNVLVQAERYSKGVTDSPLNFRGFRVPFLYSTNGEVVWFHDIRHLLNCSRRIPGFHTPSAVSQMLDRDFEEARGWFQTHANNRILLDRPRDWSTAAITELRNKLAMAPERFTVELLQKAHAIRYDKALADIISMVRHAARNEEPLTTPAERVERAFARIRHGQRFTDEQEKWLKRIRAHLTENLSIDREDFDEAPVLARAGGWKPADQTFEGKLEKLLKAINEAIAA